LILEPDQSITAEPAAESSSANPSFLSTGREPEVDTAAPPKRVQPTHLLKFRNKTIGFDTPGPGGVAAPAPIQTNGTIEAVPAVTEKKKRRKSDKGDGETPKKKRTKV
jgi:hypothetical protein